MDIRAINDLNYSNIDDEFLLKVSKLEWSFLPNNLKSYVAARSMEMGFDGGEVYTGTEFVPGNPGQQLWGTILVSPEEREDLVLGFVTFILTNETQEDTHEKASQSEAGNEKRLLPEIPKINGHFLINKLLPKIM